MRTLDPGHQILAQIRSLCEAKRRYIAQGVLDVSKYGAVVTSHARLVNQCFVSTPQTTGDWLLPYGILTDQTAGSTHMVQADLESPVAAHWAHQVLYLLST